MAVLFATFVNTENKIYEDMNEYSLEISSAERLKIACNVADGMKHSRSNEGVVSIRFNLFIPWVNCGDMQCSSNFSVG